LTTRFDTATADLITQHGQAGITGYYNKHDAGPALKKTVTRR
jgi:hypothetical protein